MGGNQSSQKLNFLNQAKDFHENKSLAYCVHLWQEGENDKMMYEENKVTKGVLPFNLEFGGMPVFQKEVQDGWENVKVKNIL